MLGRLLGRTQNNDDESENPGAGPSDVNSGERERTGKVNLEDVNRRIQAGSEAIIELNKHYQSLTISDPDQQEIKTLIGDIKVKFEQLAVLSEKQSAYNLVEEEMYDLLALATSSLKMLTKRKKKGLIFKRTTDEYKNPKMKHYKKLREKLAKINALQLKHAEAVFKDELYDLVKSELEPLDPNKEFIKFNSNGVVEQLPESFKGGGYTRKRSKSQSRKNRKQRGHHGNGHHSRQNRRQRKRNYTRKRL